ncbi:MAG TPA: GNAT family N-acetyltransferase [Chthonomonadaceae bacterium]|nr:GNAT family N-acetyltransferase [Chthonomonadaceae bacterium]
MEQGLKWLEIRPAGEEDAPHIVALYNLQERDMVPLTVARYRSESAEESGEKGGERHVALQAGRLVGYGSCRWAWWTGQPGIYSMELRVAPSHARQGIGTRLFEQMRARLALWKAARLVGWIRADSEEGLRFAARLGCHETGQVIQEYRMALADAATNAYPGLEARLLGEGLRFVSLAELGNTDEAFLHALQRLWADSGASSPDPDLLPNSFESWRQQVLLAPGLTPDTHWIALEGERPVGMTFLKRLSDDAFENDYTGVASTHRGRGIATALKRCAISWAQQQGARWFYTSSEIGNQAMITVNTRLGYRPGVQRQEFARDLP